MRLLYPLAKRFIAGHDFNSAKPQIQKLLDQGYQVSIDYVGELSKDVHQAAAAAQQYISICKYYKDTPIDISIKPSQLGLLFDRNFCEQLLHNIVVTARKYNHTIRLDMEDSNVTDDTIQLACQHRIGCAMQANLFRSAHDIWKFIDNDISVRVVKGAYKENEAIAYQDMPHIRVSYVYIVQTLLTRMVNNCAIATHDEKLLDVLLDIHGIEKFDFEFLYGIRRDLQQKLKDDGHKVRIYVPFGEDWLPYTIRRLREWKNLKFVIGNMLKELVSK